MDDYCDTYIYVPYKENSKFADLLNSGLDLCDTDYGAFLEDDDLYFPTHISHGIKSLSQSTYEVAGVSQLYIMN